MPFQVVNTARMMCSFGTAPATLVVPPVHRVNAGHQPAANILDHKPMVNITPFGLCTSLANSTVAAATSAAMGVLTPMPCVPATATPWTPGAPTVTLDHAPALDNTSTCLCNWAGVISIIDPGQTTVLIP